MDPVEVPSYCPLPPLQCSCGATFFVVSGAKLTGLGVMFNCPGCGSSISDISALERFKDLWQGKPEAQLFERVLSKWKNDKPL